MGWKAGVGSLVTVQSSSWPCVGGSCLPGTAPPPQALPGPGLAPRRPHPPVNTSPVNTPIYRCHGGGREVKQRGLPSDSGSHKSDSSSEACGVTELSAARQGWVSDKTQCSNTHCFTCSFLGHARRLSQGELSGRGGAWLQCPSLPRCTCVRTSILHSPGAHSLSPPFSWFSKL